MNRNMLVSYLTNIIKIIFSLVYKLNGIINTQKKNRLPLENLEIPIAAELFFLQEIPPTKMAEAKHMAPYGIQ